MRINQCIVTLISLLLIITSCRKLIAVDSPSQWLTTGAVYKNLETTESVLASSYFLMANNSNTVFSGFGSLHLGLSADELIPYNINVTSFRAFYMNEFSSDIGFLTSGLWGIPYQIIYSANSIIENVPYTNFKDSVKNELMGQAYFLRAFCNFYLVNLFGDIPIVTTTNWQQTKLLFRRSKEEVYRLILADLQYAREHLLPNYNAGKGERILPSRYAADALLARVHLYLKNWVEAESYADSLIAHNDLFSLVTLNDIVAPNNKEAIWQLKQYSDGRLYSPEGSAFIPSVKNSTIPPSTYISPDFLNGFEEGDLRKKNWIDSTRLTTSGIVYYYPYKYKTNSAMTLSAYSEYQTVFRLAEIYLIRAEALLETGRVDAAITDLNLIRKRAGLPKLPQGLSEIDVRKALIKERRFELFAERGHRWLDLKRWGLAGTVLKPIKANWEETDELYPIPSSDRLANPNITQNPGYNF